MIMARGRQHVAKFLTKIWKHIGVLKTGEELVREWNHDNKLKGKGGCFVTIPDRVACRSQNEEHWTCGVFLTAKDHRQGKTSSKKYEGLVIFSDKGCSLELI
jgi:hypothetical protein